MAHKTYTRPGTIDTPRAKLPSQQKKKTDSRLNTDERHTREAARLLRILAREAKPLPPELDRALETALRDEHVSELAARASRLRAECRGAYLEAIDRKQASPHDALLGLEALEWQRADAKASRLAEEASALSRAAGAEAERAVRLLGYAQAPAGR